MSTWIPRRRPKSGHLLLLDAFAAGLHGVRFVVAARARRAVAGPRRRRREQPGKRAPRRSSAGPPPSADVRDPQTAAPDAQSPGNEGRHFVIAAVGSCFGLLGMVLAFNTVVDPFAIAGTHAVPAAVQTDRAIKLTLLGRYPGRQDLLILGNSRARQAEPAFVRRLTGLRGFNAGVSSGRASDAYVFARYAADVHPRRERRYIWFVDVWSMMNGVNPQLADDPRAKRYLDGSGRFGLRDAGIYISMRASAASLRAIRACVVGSCVAQSHGYRADGSFRHRARPVSAAEARRVRAAAAGAVRRIRRNPPTAGQIAPRPYVYFERALAFMNARGERPVIVLNPRYPTILAELRRHGHPERRAVLAYLRRLRARFDFVFLDCENIRRWGGTARDFMDPAHVHWRNMRRLLRYVVAHSHGALR